MQRVNALELAVLDALDYVIRVPASEYAKYYFHLRSMMARLGYHSTETSQIEPLDINGARRLQLATERYQQDQQLIRSNSHEDHDNELNPRKIRLERIASADFLDNTYHHNVSVGLEQIIHTEHNDADGLAKLNKTPSSKEKPKSSIFGIFGSK